MNRKLSILVAFVVMMIMGTSIALATDYVPPLGTSSAEGTSACVSLDGEAGAVFDGNLTQIDAANNFVNIDFWWRGEPNSPENYVFLEGLVFANTYQPLAGTLWRFPVNMCSREQAYAKFNEHVSARQADPTVNSGFVVTWEQSGIFIPVEGNANTAPTADPAMDPAPVDNQTNYVGPEVNVFDSPMSEPLGELTVGEVVSVDTDAATILADANSDGRNPYEKKGSCQPLGPRSFGLDTEASTSGANLIIGYYNDDEGRNRVTVLPNGSFALGGPMYTEDESEDILGNSQNQPLDVHCSFNEMLVQVDAFLAEYGLDHSALIGFKETGMFTRKDRPGASVFYGVGNSVDNPNACRLISEGLLQKRKVVGNATDYWQIDGWLPSGMPDIGNAEVSTVIDPGQEFDVSKNPKVKGWVRQYTGATCRRAQVLSEMTGNADRRINNGENVVGWTNNWNNEKFQMHPAVGGGWAQNPFLTWLSPR